MPSIDKVLIGKDDFDEKMDNLILAVHSIGAIQGGETKITSWAQIQQIVRAGLAPKVFAIGDQLLVTKGASTIAFDIIGFDVDTPANPDFTHSMTLQAHNTVISMQFDASELMLYCPDGLAAGTYHFKLDHGMYGGNTGSDGDYQFTITQPIPAKGGLRHSTIGSYQSAYTKAIVTGGTFTTYNADCSTLESGIACTEGTGGTDLGTFSAREQYCTAEEKLTHNCTEKQYYGNNNYLKSNLRQWVNSNKAANAWFEKSHIFDMPCNQKNVAGFLSDLDPEFLAIVGLATKDVKEDEVWDKGGMKTFADKFFLLSNKEIRFSTYADEGVNYPYWTRLIPVATNDANDNRIKSNTYWWTRTCHRSYGHTRYYAKPTGACSSYDACSTHGVVPACVII